MKFNIVIHVKNNDIIKIYNNNIRNSAINYLLSLDTNIDKKLYNNINEIKNYDKSYYLVKKDENKIEVYKTLFGYVYNSIIYDSYFLESIFNTINENPNKAIKENYNIYKVNYIEELLEVINKKKLKIE